MSTKETNKKWEKKCGGCGKLLHMAEEPRRDAFTVTCPHCGKANKFTNKAPAGG